MLFVVVVCRLLFVSSDLSFVVRCLWCVACLFVVRCSSFVGCRVSFANQRLFIVVCRLLCVVWWLLFVGCCTLLGAC